MRLTREGIREKQDWEKAGIRLPGYDVDTVTEKAREAAKWVHFGIGNIFRIFIGGIADGLLEEGYLDRGVTCVETFDYDVVDKIYDPFDNLALSVILKSDGSRDLKVLADSAEAVKGQSSDEKSWKRMKEIFTSKDLQIVSFTITEKGYALTRPDGSYLPWVQAELEGGPDSATSAMGIVTAMLLERFRQGKLPVALVSMDNCSQNGSHLQESVCTVAKEWIKRGFAGEDFLAYLEDDSFVAFPWTMIDKITPRPSEQIAEDLEKLGVENMSPVITSKRTYIAPFVNAEGPQYLVIEDSFPNGRPALEHGKGVYMADRNTVNLAERMKVTACLNPVHSALGPLGVLLGYDLFADVMEDPQLNKIGRTVAYGEGMQVIEDPKILSPKAFTDELFEDRFPNRYLGDTNLRLCTDITQGFGVRFGVTIQHYTERDGSAAALKAIPLGLAGCMRYFMGVDDQGKSYELAPDPLADEIHERLSTVELGKPETFTDQLRPILSNPNIFFTDLYKEGIGEKIEDIFREMLKGNGACRETVDKYAAEM